MYRPPAEMRIADVDRENNTVYLIVNGHLIEAICHTEDDPKPMEQIQQVLLKSFIGKSF